MEFSGALGHVAGEAMGAFALRVVTGVSLASAGDLLYIPR